MPGASDAEDLQVDAAGVGDRLLVGGARGGDPRLRQTPVGEVHVLGTNVDVVEEMLLHEAAVALMARRIDRPVLVEIEGDDVREGEAILAMHANEFLVERGRRGAGREAEHAGAMLRGSRSDERGDLGGERPRRAACVAMDLDGHLLEGRGEMPRLAV